MKLQLNLLTLMLMLLTLGVGCTADDANFSDTDGSEGVVVDPNSKGYLSFSGFELSIEEGEYENLSDDASDRVLATTRSSVDVDDFIVRITGVSSGETVFDGTYEDIKSEPTYTLSAGVYLVEVMSCETADIPLAKWDAPEYYGSKRCVVGNDDVTKVGEIISTLSNVKVSVSMSVDLIAEFKTENLTADDLPLEVTIVAGSGELVFDPTSGDEYGYFTAPEDETLTVYLSGMYYAESQQEYRAINKGDWQESITGVKAGQYRNIEVKIDYNGEGAIGIKLEVSTWVYEEEIDVDVTSTTYLSATLSEEVIADPEDVANAPLVSVDNGVGVEDVYIITDSMFDIDTKTYSPTYKLYITPQGDETTVKSVAISIESTSTELMASLASYGFDGSNSIVLYESGSMSSSALSSYISIREDSSTGEVIAAVLYDGMFALSTLYGKHTIELTTTDSQNRVSTTTLYIESVNSSLPTIEWVGGYDFEQQYEIFTSDEVEAGEGENPEITLVITSTASAGITTLLLSIDSEVISDELLVNSGLASEMDLINCEGDLKETLGNPVEENGLGLPVGDEVKGQNSLTLDITSFLELLALQGVGTSVFTVYVADDNGDVSGTVQLIKK